MNLHQNFSPFTIIVLTIVALLLFFPMTHLGYASPLHQTVPTAPPPTTVSPTLGPTTRPTSSPQVTSQATIPPTNLPPGVPTTQVSTSPQPSELVPSVTQQPVGGETEAATATSSGIGTPSFSLTATGVLTTAATSSSSSTITNNTFSILCGAAIFVLLIGAIVWFLVSRKKT